MQSQSQPDVISRNSAISACSKGWSPEQAPRLLLEILCVRQEPSVTNHSAAINAGEKLHEWELMLGLLHGMWPPRLEADASSWSAAGTERG